MKLSNSNLNGFRDFEKSDSAQITILTIPALDGEVLETIL